MTSPATPSNDGQEILALFVKEIKRRLSEEAQELKAADFEMIRKLLQDNNLTLASVQRGEFGALAQEVAQNFPFPGTEEGPILVGPR